MAGTAKLKLLSDAIKAQFLTILTTGGYQTNIGSKVYRWKLDDWTTANMPGLAFRLSKLTNAETEKVDPNGESGYSEKNDVILEVVVATEKAASTTADDVEAEILQMIQDVEDAIRAKQKPVGAAWNNLAVWTSLETIEIEMDKQDKIIGEARLTFKIRMKNKYLDAVN